MMEGGVYKYLENLFLRRSHYSQRGCCATLGWCWAAPSCSATRTAHLLKMEHAGKLLNFIATVEIMLEVQPPQVPWPAAFLCFILCRDWQPGMYRLLISLWVLSLIYSMQYHGPENLHFQFQLWYEEVDLVYKHSVLQCTSVRNAGFSSLLLIGRFPVPRAKVPPHTKWPFLKAWERL